MTRVTYEQFRDEISSQIRRVSGQEEDPGFVVTLRNYVLGLVKHHGTAEPAAMQKKLKEFLEENTTSFVTWLCDYMRENDVVTSADGAAEPSAGPTRQRSGEQPERVQSKAGQVAVFQAALRSAEGDAVSVKQEQFAAPPPTAAAAPPSAAHRAAKAEQLHMVPAAPAPPALAPPGWAAYLQAATAQASAPTQEIDATSVVVMNVHFTSTPETLGLFFHQRCGGVMRATILKNAHGMPKGYAYMQLTDAAAAQRAQQLTGTDFMGRTLRVVPKYKRPPPASLPPWMMSPLQMLPMMYSQMAPLFNYGLRSGAGAGEAQGWGRSGRQWGMLRRKGRSDVWLRNERAIEA